MRKGLILSGILALPFMSFAIPGINVEASVGYIQHDPSGSFAYEGSSIDIERDVGLDKENKPFARLKVELPLIPNLYVQYMPMEFNGTKQSTVTYGGKTLTGSLDTTVKMDRYDVGLYYNIPIGWITSLGTLGTLSLDPEIGINVRVINFEGTITGTVVNTGISETVSKSVTVPVPMGYAGLSVNVPFISLIGEVRYISYGGNKYYDWLGEVRIKPIPLGFVGVGYREEKLKLDDVDGVYSDITIKGFYANVGISF